MVWATGAAGEAEQLSLVEQTEQLACTGRRLEEEQQHTRASMESLKKLVERAATQREAEEERLRLIEEDSTRQR